MYSRLDSSSGEREDGCSIACSLSMVYSLVVQLLGWADYNSLSCFSIPKVKLHFRLVDNTSFRVRNGYVTKKKMLSQVPEVLDDSLRVLLRPILLDPHFVHFGIVEFDVGKELSVRRPPVGC